jgi:hypothetical protein
MDCPSVPYYFQPQLFPRLRQPTTKKKTRYTLNPADRKIFEALYKLGYMSADQMRRYLGQSINSLPKLRQRLVILSGESKTVLSDTYLNRFYQPRETPFENLPFLYSMGTRALAELANREYDTKPHRRFQYLKKVPGDYEHHLAINELLIAALCFPGVVPTVELFDFQHDFMLKRHPEMFQVSVSKGTGSRLEEVKDFSPDAIVDFRILRPGQKPIPRKLIIEVEMKSHEAVAFKKKIACYQDFFASGMYKKHFDNVNNVSVLFITPKGEGRRDLMRQWTQQQYEKPVYTPLHEREEDVKKFLFAAMPSGALDSLKTFVQPLCFSVFPKNARPEPVIQLPTKETIVK